MSDDELQPARHKFDWHREEWIDVAPDDFSIGTRPVPSSEQAKRWNDANAALFGGGGTALRGLEG